MQLVHRSKVIGLIAPVKPDLVNSRVQIEQFIKAIKSTKQTRPSTVEEREVIYLKHMVEKLNRRDS